MQDREGESTERQDREGEVPYANLLPQRPGKGHEACKQHVTYAIILENYQIQTKAPALTGGTAPKPRYS